MTVNAIGMLTMQPSNQQNSCVQEGRNPTLVNLASGTAAAVCATLVTQPADVIRTRMQLVSAKGTHIGPLKTLQALLQTDGAQGLLVGTVPRVSILILLHLAHRISGQK